MYVRQHQPRKPSTRRALAKRVGLAVATLVMGLLVVEGVVRLFGLAPTIRAIDTSDPASAYKRSGNPILGYELKADYRNPNADLLTSLPRTNAHGQRDVERSVEKPPGVKRVILLGDSVLESMEVRDIEHVMHRRLERLFPKNTVEVLNFGVNGYCTLAEVELLRVKGLAFKPDVVIVVSVYNDFNNFNAAVHAFASRPRRPALVNGLFRGSHLFRLAFIRLNLFGFSAEENPAEWNAAAIGDNNVVAGLAMLKALADEEGFRPAIAVWPQFTEDGFVNAPVMRDGADALVVERLAAYHEIPCFRMSERFARDYAARGADVGPSEVYTVGDGMHANEEGSRVAALALKEILDALDSRSHAVSPPSAAEYARALARVQVIEQDLEEGLTPQGILADEVVSVADLLADRGKLEEAIRLYTKAIAMDGTAEAHVGLGNALQALGHTREALEHYRQAVQLKPDHAKARNNLGHALLLQGMPRDAIEHYREALRIDPGLAESHYGWGLALGALGNTHEATRHFEEALRLDPGHVAARKALRETGNPPSQALPLP